MGNAAARQRLKFKDFAYIAKNTNFASRGIVEDYYNDLIAKCPIGKMDLEQFKVTFRLAFPERPEEKLLLLTEKVANVDKTDGMIRKCHLSILILLQYKRANNFKQVNVNLLNISCWQTDGDIICKSTKLLTTVKKFKAFFD